MWGIHNQEQYCQADSFATTKNCQILQVATCWASMPLIPWFYAGSEELSTPSLTVFWAGSGELSTPSGLNQGRKRVGTDQKCNGMNSSQAGNPVLMNGS